MVTDFAGARAADDDQRLARLKDEIDAVEHDLGAEALLDAAQFDFRCSGHRGHFENRMEVRR